MLSLMRMTAAVLLSVLCLCAVGPTRADDRDDHERARDAMTSGEIRPLAEILSEVERHYVGRVIQTELERDDGRWVYELKLLPASGRVYQLKIDAGTGKVMRAKGPVQERR